MHKQYFGEHFISLLRQIQRPSSYEKYSNIRRPIYFASNIVVDVSTIGCILHLSAITLNVSDVGAGTGIWAIDMGLSLEDFLVEGIANPLSYLLTKI